MYCSEHCREEAWKEYHEYECPCTSILHANRTPRYVLLSFRILCKLGPEAAYNLFEAGGASLEVNQELGPGFDSKTGIYSSSSYLPIYYLVSHPSQHDHIETFSNTFQSLALVHCLQKLTSYFQFAEAVRKDEFRTWLASLLLHHIQSVPCNSISLDELKESNQNCSTLATEAHLLEPGELAEKMRILQFDQYASAAYGVISLLNHSCDPNVTRINDSVNGRMAIVSQRGLKAGEPLTTSYTKVFQNEGSAERREYLRANYYFLCGCKPCAENWPLLSQLSKQQDPKFICPKCSRNFNGGGSDYLLDKKGRCGKCNQTLPISKLLKEYNKFIETFYQSYQLVLENKPVNAIKNLLPCLEYFNNRIPTPFSKTYMAQDVLRRALDLITYFS